MHSKKTSNKLIRVSKSGRSLSRGYIDNIYILGFPTRVYAWQNTKYARNSINVLWELNVLVTNVATLSIDGNLVNEALR